MMTEDHLFHVARYPSQHPGIERNFLGNLLRDDTKNLLLGQIQKLKPKLIVEIGSWVGGSAALIAFHSDAKIICLDTWRGSRDIYELRDMAPFVMDSFERFCTNTWEYRDRIHPLKIDGVSGMRMVWETQLKPELVFIDAGHEYESAYGDLHMTLRCFPDVTIVFDDWDHNGVAQAITECSAKFERPYKIQGCAAIMEGHS